MECHSKWNVTQNEKPLEMLKIDCHSNGMSRNLEHCSKWIVTQNGMSFKIDYHSKWLKLECHSKWNVT